MSPPVGRLAEVLEPIEAQTPYGGRSTTYLPLGSVGVTLDDGSVRARVVAGRDPATARRTVEARQDERLSRGRVLRLDGSDWHIRTVEPRRSGWTVLGLEAAR